MLWNLIGLDGLSLLLFQWLVLNAGVISAISAGRFSLVGGSAQREYNCMVMFISAWIFKGGRFSGEVIAL